MRENGKARAPFMLRVEGKVAAIVLLGVAAWGAGCGTSGDEPSSSPSAGSSGYEVDVQPNEPDEPGEPGASPAAAGLGAAGTSDSQEAVVERPPIVGLPPRGVSDFEIEARQPTERAADARGLGGACRSTADCRAGLGCADVIFSGVGESHIAGGYCSRWCEQDADCALLEPGATCASQLFGSDLSFCVKHCVTGANEGDAKCGGRADLSCSIGRAPGVDTSCIPSCTADADCERGRCSSGHGLCDVNLSSFARPPGAPCSTSEAACNGYCEPSSESSGQGVCSGFCRLGSTCGAGVGTVCASEQFGLREGDGGTCERACNTSADCAPGYTACAPTGLLTPSGEPQKGCVHIYAEPASLAPQRLSVEELALAALPSSVMNVSTTSIFQALSHRLAVEDGAVCVFGNVIGDFGALLELDFQLRPNNGSPLDATGLSGFSFEAEGPHVVRFDAYTTVAWYRYLIDPITSGDLAEGPQRIGIDQLFDIFSRDAFTALEAPQLEALRFSLILEDGAGPFRFCLRALQLEGLTPDSPDP